MLYAVKLYERKGGVRGYVIEPGKNGNHYTGCFPVYFPKEQALDIVKNAEKAYIYQADLIGEDGSIEHIDALKKPAPKKLAFGKFRL